ncbi:MAG: hypothetical protein ACI8UR_001313 [Natronomonas sp.]|jgi:hypothetical protein|uniref:cyanase n=1 Tax=Natronomonas sp. TaxID=2184060 RepID=UPI0039E44D1B
MLYRLYEIPQVYGDAIKAVVHEEFGDGIMSAIDFECHVDRIEAEVATACASPTRASSSRIRNGRRERSLILPAVTI